MSPHKLKEMIAFDNVGYCFDKQWILRGFSESIRRGEHLCFMGESGVGKTTLLKSIVGLTVPTEGMLYIEGEELNASTVSHVRCLTSWVPQEVNLPYTFVKETMAAPFELKTNRHSKLDENLMFEWFSRLGLPKEIYEKRMLEISGGEKQRLMLILGVLLNKKILLLDEPTSALDKHNKDRLIEALSSLEFTIVAITHDKSFAQSFHRTVEIQKTENRGIGIE